MTIAEPTKSHNSKEGHLGPTVVGIGASAGGFPALRSLFEPVPEDSGLAFVVVVHLAPDQKSQLAELLRPHVRIPVEQLNGTVPLAPNRIYIIPPGRNLEAIDSHLHLSKLESRRSERAPIDHFFRTLAATHDGNSVGVLLSGLGSDGTLGIQQVKARGGLTIVQEPQEAEYDSMVQSALATGAVDLVLPAGEIAERARLCASTKPRFPLGELRKPDGSTQSALLSTLFACVRARTGRDFARYRHATTMRRIRRRMQLAQLEELEAYVELLERDPEEVAALAADFLITVTSFFRDVEVFEQLRDDIVPLLFADRDTDAAVRVWSAGCATGEEAYSLAMMLLDEAARHDPRREVQVFASDLNEAALMKAREGCYYGDFLADVPDEYVQRYFKREDGGYRIRKDVRDAVLFATHDLLSDPPFSKLDLLVCRNLLIYLERDLQADVIEVFHYALNPDGWLVLGTAENVENSALFVTHDKSHSFYRKRNVPGPEPHLPVFPLSRPTYVDIKPSPAPKESASYGAMHQRLVENFAPPSILVGPNQEVVHLSERAGRYLRHPGGNPTTSVVKLVRPELQVELTSVLHAVKEGGLPVWSRPIALSVDGETRQVVMYVCNGTKDDSDGFLLVVFQEHARPPEEGQDDGASLTTTTKNDAELSLTRQRLQTVIRQYETGQEEMRASNEELQSANEELRSTMEELETSKEELQSINEELLSVNQENRNKVTELTRLSSDLKSLMAATHIATLFLDRELRIVRFTPQVSEIFNLLAVDRGRPLSDITHRLGYPTLLQDAATVLENLTPVEREVQDEEENRCYLARMRPYRTVEDRIEGVVVTFVDITAHKASEAALSESEQRYRSLFESIDEAFCVLEAIQDESARIIDFRFLEANAAFAKQTGIPNAVGQTLSQLNTPLEHLWFDIYDRVASSGEPMRIEAEAHASNRWFDIYAFRVPRSGDKRVAILSKEITLRKHAESTLRSVAERDGFRVALGDAIRHLGDPIAIQNASCRLVAQQLRAQRVTFYEMSRNTLLPTAQFPASVATPSRTLELGAASRESLQNGNIVVEVGAESAPISDVRGVEGSDPTALGAHIIIPLLTEDRLDAALAIADRAPRDWTQADIQLAEDAAERAWGAAQHAQAESLRKSELALRDADRKKDEFLAMLSHELRNPLAPIMNSLYVMGQVPAGSQQAIHAQAVISRQTAQLARLVDDLLDLSRVTRGNLQLKTEPVDINELVKQTFADFEAQFESGDIQAELIQAEEPLWIRGDRNRLAQVLGNILHNCGKFTQPEGRLLVAVSADVMSGRVVVRVKDSGIGMTPELLGRVFEPFVQADAGLERGKAGLGLGLALARRLVERHDGTITAHSEGLGMGAEFTIYLPTSPKGSKRSEPPAMSCPPTAKRILIIEDNEDAAETLRLALEFGHHDISVARNGREGVAKARELLPDVVLCDIGLPVMDGYQVARAIRADDQLKGIYLIALSGYGMPEDKRRAQNVGFDKHVVKPPNLNELARILNDA